MTNYPAIEKRGINSIQFITDIFNFTKIIGLIHLLEIIIKVGKYFPIIIILLASLKLLMAANDLLTNSITFAILNSLFAIGDFIFLVQLYQRHKAHPYDFNLRPNTYERYPTDSIVIGTVFIWMSLVSLVQLYKKNKITKCKY